MTNICISLCNARNCVYLGLVFQSHFACFCSPELNVEKQGIQHWSNIFTILLEKNTCSDLREQVERIGANWLSWKQTCLTVGWGTCLTPEGELVQLQGQTCLTLGRQTCVTAGGRLAIWWS